MQNAIDCFTSYDRYFRGSKAITLVLFDVRLHLSATQLVQIWFDMNDTISELDSIKHVHSLGHSLPEGKMQLNHPPNRFLGD